MTTGSDQEQPIARDVILDVRLARAKDTHRVQVRRIRILPGQAAGLHVHNGPVVGSIVDGSAVFQIEGGSEAVLRRGDVFYEPEGARIARFDAQEAGVTFLASGSCSDRTRSPRPASSQASTSVTGRNPRSRSGL